MSDLAKQYANSLFACFQMQGTMELYAEEPPEWIEVAPNFVRAYRNNLVIYELDRHEARGMSYFSIYPVSESKLMYTISLLCMTFYDLRGTELRHFIERLHDLGVIWTT